MEKSQEQETPVHAVSSDGAKQTNPPSPSNPANPTSNLHTKQRGELAELAFMFKAVSMGFGVAKPWGDSERYDIILNAGRVLWRVRIKSSFSQKGCNVMACGGNGIPYTADEIDFFVVYISPRDLWYVFPIAAVRHRDIQILPTSRRSHHDKFREAWWLFGEPSRTIPPPAIL